MAPRLRPLVAALLSLILLGACAAPGAAPSRGISSLPATATSSPSVGASSPSAAASGYPLTLQDDAGRSVTLSESPQRIVSLAPSNTEIVCAVGACDRLVGVTDFDDYPAQVRSLPKVVVNAAPDVEKIVAARPALVLAAGNQQTPQAILQRLAELQIPTLVLYPESLDGIYTDIELVGAAIGRTDAATALVAEMRGRVAKVREAVAGAPRPRVFYEVSVYQGVIYTAGKDSFLASLVDLAGGEPITGDATGVIQLEDLVRADPQLILLGDAAYPPPVTAEQVAARPGWSELSAVRSSAVAPMPQDPVITRPGPRIVEGLEALARAIHPDRFGGQG